METFLSDLGSSTGLTIPVVLALVAMGACSGFLAGLLGIGGGMVMVPVMTLLFASQGFPIGDVVKMAVATSLSTILFTSVSSVRAHWKQGAVKIALLRWLGPGAMLGTFAGAQFAGALPGQVLALVFAGIVGWVSLQMLRNAKRPPGNAPMPGRLGLFTVGLGIGGVSSLVGAGGGFLTVPFLSRSGVAIREAVATSAGMGFPIAAGGLVGYVLAGLHAPGLPPHTLGYVYLPALGVLVMCSVTTAPWGARLAHSMPTVRLKQVFALVLLALAAAMLHRALQG